MATAARACCGATTARRWSSSPSRRGARGTPSSASPARDTPARWCRRRRARSWRASTTARSTSRRHGCHDSLILRPLCRTEALLIYFVTAGITSWSYHGVPEETMKRILTVAVVIVLAVPLLAFLQREPDAGGQCFWTNDACAVGRKHPIRAFEVSIEFGNLVNGLYDDGPAPTCHPGE